MCRSWLLFVGRVLASRSIYCTHLQSQDRSISAQSLFCDSQCLCQEDFCSPFSFSCFALSCATGLDSFMAFFFAANSSATRLASSSFFFFSSSAFLCACSQ